jgi:hypothetical protein
MKRAVRLLSIFLLLSQSYILPAEAGPLLWACNALLRSFSLGSYGPPRYLWSSASPFSLWGQTSFGMRSHLWEIPSPYGEMKISTTRRFIDFEIEPLPGFKVLSLQQREELKARYPGIRINQAPSRNGDELLNRAPLLIEYTWDERSDQPLAEFQSSAQQLFRFLTTDPNQ